MTITPTPEINYLTLVVAGGVLLWAAAHADKRGDNGPGIAFVMIGVALFAIGTLRALMGAFNV